MKIIIPELQDPIIKHATEHFPDLEFLPASDLNSATEKAANHEADTVISGFNYTTRDVILAYKDHFPLKSKYFSSCFICERGNQTLAIADGGVIKHPDEDQLYTIIEDTATTFIKFTGKQPKIALLSYSTHHSGTTDDSEFQNYTYCIDKITKNHPDWIIDGELQLDAAVNPTVAAKKSPDSPIRGQANILITPDLNSGNILYKSLEQFGGFTIAGPIIQGFETPLADLSRGSSVEDIILTIKVIRSLL